MSISNRLKRRVSKGFRIHWFWKEEEELFYHHDSVFVSRGIQERYEDRGFSLQFVETTVPQRIVEEEAGEFDIDFSGHEDSVESLISENEILRSVLEQEEIPVEQQRSTVFTQDFLSAFESNSVSNVFGIVLTGARCDNGTVNEFNGEEDDIRENLDKLDTKSNSNLYSGPLFLYDKDIQEGQTVLERKAPINIIWQRPLGCKGISLSKRMKTNGWRGLYNYSLATRYAIVEGDDRRIRTHGDEAAKRKGLPLKQMHIRMVEIPYTMDSVHIVAGGAHRDPWLHGKVTKHIQNPNWRFAQARKETIQDWFDWGYPIATFYAGNDDDWNSSNGEIGVVKPL